MHEGNGWVLPLLLLATGSFLVPVLARRVRVPSPVLLIAYGTALGPHALGWLADGPVVAFLYEVGFVVLMFLAGLEIDFNGIRRRGARPLLGLLGVCLGIFGLAFAAAALLGLPPIFGLALGATSVGLPLAVLRETGRLRSPLGQSILLLGSVGEFVTVVALTLYYFGKTYGASAEFALALGRFVGLLVAAAATLRVFTAVAWWRPERFAKLTEAQEDSELGVRAALLLMLAFAALAVAAGVEIIVGAFLAGALLAFVIRGKEVLEEKLAAVGHGLFVPIFFVIVGLYFDPRVLSVNTLALLGLLLLANLGVRVLPSLALLLQGLSLRDALGAAHLLAAPLTLVVAIATVGAQVGDLQPAGEGTLVALAVASGVLFPVAFRVMAR